MLFLSRRLNADVVGVYREETIAGITVLIVREGSVINSNEFIFNKGNDVPSDELLRMFLLRYYDSTSSIPHELIIGEMPEDYEVLEEWLTDEARRVLMVHRCILRFRNVVKKMLY